MALRWAWSDKVGTMTLVQKHEGEDDREFSISLYDGNCFLIMLNEWAEDGEHMYSMYNFFADKEHAKNCLGLNKRDGYTSNILNTPYNTVTKFRLSKNYRYLKDLVPMLVKAFDNITIEIYSEKGDNT